MHAEGGNPFAGEFRVVKKRARDRSICTMPDRVADQDEIMEAHGRHVIFQERKYAAGSFAKHPGNGPRVSGMRIIDDQYPQAGTVRNFHVYFTFR